MSVYVEALVSRAATGKEQADSSRVEARDFPALVAASQRRVFQIAYGVLGDAGEAEEIAQEAFLQAYRRLASLRDPAKFRAWVGRIALRLALNRRRARGRQLVRDTAWQAARPATLEAPGTDRLWLERVRAEIDRLPEKLRAVLLLSAVEEMEAAEVAAVLEIPPGTVRSRLHRARRLLLEALNP